MPAAAPAADEAVPAPRGYDVSERVGFWRRAGYLLGPILISAALWFLVHLFSEGRIAEDLLFAGGASLFGLGTTVIFGPAVLPELADLTTWELAVLVMWVNGASGFWYVYNLDLLQKVWKIGPWLRRERMNAVRTLEQRPWIRRLSVVGVALFVITPLPGSGALGGAIVGRLIGVSKYASFVAVSIAGVVVAFGYALLADELKQFLDREAIPLWIRIAGVVLVILLAYLLYRIVRRLAHPHPPRQGKTVPPTGE